MYKVVIYTHHLPTDHVTDVRHSQFRALHMFQLDFRSLPDTDSRSELKSSACAQPAKTLNHVNSLSLLPEREYYITGELFDSFSTECVNKININQRTELCFSANIVI